MNHKITDEMRKLLTEKVLGEKWHGYELSKDGKGLSRCSCGNHGMAVWDICTKENRDFDTDQDRTDVFRKLKDWDRFCYFAKTRLLCNEYDSDFIFDLCIDNPERACCLVAEFWRKHK